MKAIETKYKGYRFRSRLEARWAVFFDSLNLTWRYEPQGFVLGGKAYLPDFWLPDLKLWVEVKAFDVVNDIHKRLCSALACESKCDVAMVFDHLEPLDAVRANGGGRNMIWHGVGYTINESPAGFAECSVCGTIRYGLYGHFTCCEEDEFFNTCNACLSFNDEDFYGEEDNRLACWNCGELLFERVPSWKQTDSERIMKAFEAARSARFEHGWIRRC